MKLRKDEHARRLVLESLLLREEEHTVVSVGTSEAEHTVIGRREADVARLSLI
jgi:hypothetical protein